MAQRGWDHEVRPGWHGDHAARVAARGDHADVSGQGQPVTRPPAQRLVMARSATRPEASILPNPAAIPP